MIFPNIKALQWEQNKLIIRASVPEAIAQFTLPSVKVTMKLENRNINRETNVNSIVQWQQRVGNQRDWVWRGWQTRYTYIRPSQNHHNSTP